MRTSPTLPSPLLFQNNHITTLGNINPLFTTQRPCKYMEFSHVVLSDYTSLPEQFAVFPSGVHCPFVDLHSWPCHYFFPNCTKEPPNLSEYDFINEQPSQGLPQCHFPTGESLSEPSVPFLSAALLWDWDLPLPLTWAFLPLPLLPFSLRALLSFPPLCVPFIAEEHVC